MNVLLVSMYPPPTGGIASWTKRFLEFDLPNGWKIINVNSSAIGSRSVENSKRPLRYEILRCFKVWKDVLRALRKEKIDIIHICIPCTPTGIAREIVTAMFSKIARKPVILHCHSTLPNVVNGRFKLAFFKFICKFCDGIITLNSNSTDFAKKHTKSIVRQIVNFVSLSEMKGVEKRKYRQELKDALYVGNVLPTKGCDIIIDVAKKMPNIKFHMVGPVSLEIKKLEHSDNVIFYGNQKRERIKDFMANADVFLFPSRFYAEGFSCALLEAMSAGLPCVVTDWAANADMIGNNEGGVVMKDNSEKSLIEAIESIADSKTREKMGKRNFEKASNDYNENIIIRQYTKFYEDLIMRNFK